MKALAVPKKPMSEAQKANFQRMLELNKKRREAQGKEPIESPPIPDEVPDGYKVVYVPPKHNTAPKEKKEKVVERVVERAPQDLYEMIKQMNDRMNSFQMPQAQAPVLPAPKPKPPKATKKKVKEETTEQESESESGFDTSDTEYVKKYQKKAAKRMDAIQQIESKLKQQAPPKNKYDSMGSFF